MNGQDKTKGKEGQRGGGRQEGGEEERGEAEKWREVASGVVG